MFVRIASLILLAGLFSLPATAATKMCVFDPIGANGEAYKLVKRYALEAKAIGVDLELKPYTDESVALGDFLSGQCAALAATDIRVRRFNRFSTTLSAVGAIPTYDQLRTAILTISSPKAADLMVQDGYEILGVFPMGAAYLFVNDRSIDTAAELAGKRMATLEYHKDAIHMVKYVNATVVPADITNFGGKFNNGMADAAYAPAYAYQALELYKGVGETGGVVKYPLGQLTMQVVASNDLFPQEKAQKLREIAAGLFDTAMNGIQKHENSIPEEDWITIPEKDIADYQEMFRQNRLQLRDGVDSNGNKVEQVYHPKMLTLLRKIRCRADPSASECTAPDRE